MIRDSSPEPARTWPGATRSTSVTSQPASAQWRASDAPKTPAPTTTSEGGLLTARRLDGLAQCLTRMVFDVAVEALYGATLTYLTWTRHVPGALELLLEGEGLVGRLEPGVDGFHFLPRFCCQLTRTLPDRPALAVFVTRPETDALRPLPILTLPILTRVFRVAGSV